MTTPSEWALSLVNPGEWGDLPKRDRAREQGRRDRDVEVAQARADERAAIVADLLADADRLAAGGEDACRLATEIVRRARRIERGAHIPPTPESR